MHRYILGAATDHISRLLASADTHSAAQLLQVIDRTVYHYAKALASSIFRFHDDHDNLGGSRTRRFRAVPARKSARRRHLLIFPGLNLRKGEYQITRYFPPVDDRLNRGLRYGAFLFCDGAGCTGVSRSATGPDQSVTTCGCDPAGLAPAYAFDWLLSEDSRRDGRLRLCGRFPPPARGTHAWLLAQPSVRCKEGVVPLTTLRVHRHDGRLTSSHRKSELTHGILSIDLSRNDSHELGRAVGIYLDRRRLVDAREWPYRPDALATREELTFERRIYDAWLASVFEPESLCVVVRDLRHHGITLDVPDDHLAFEGAPKYCEWLSFSLSPTTPVLRPLSEGDRSLATVLGSLMVLADFPLPSAPLVLADFRRATELAYLKIRAADDAQISADYYSASGIASISHELRKWASTLNTMAGQPEERYSWSSIAASKAPREATVLRFASRYARALQFITSPPGAAMGLLTLNTEWTFDHWIRECWHTTLRLFEMSVVSKLDWSERGLVSSCAMLDYFGDAVQANVPCRIGTPLPPQRWSDLYLRYGFRIEPDTIAHSTCVLVTHLLNFLKHGLWRSGWTIDVSLDDEAITIRGHNLSRADRAACDGVLEGELLERVKALVTAASTSDVTKLVSSHQTLVEIEMRDAALTAKHKPQLVVLPPSLVGDRWTWGLKLCSRRQQ